MTLLAKKKKEKKSKPKICTCDIRNNQWQNINDQEFITF